MLQQLEELGPNGALQSCEALFVVGGILCRRIKSVLFFALHGILSFYMYSSFVFAPRAAEKDPSPRFPLCSL